MALMVGSTILVQQHVENQYVSTDRITKGIVTHVGVNDVAVDLENGAQAVVRNERIMEVPYALV